MHEMKSIKIWGSPEVTLYFTELTPLKAPNYSNKEQMNMVTVK